MKPKIMVMDEPTTGLDPLGAKQIMSLLYELNQEDMSIIISSHDMEIITQFADKILILHEGKFMGKALQKKYSTILNLLKRLISQYPSPRQYYICLKKMVSHVMSS